MDTTKMLESPPSFCNGLGTIYIYSILSRKDFFDLTTRDIGSKLRYDLGSFLSLCLMS